MGEEIREDQRIRLRSDAQPAEIEVLTPEPAETSCHVAEESVGPAGQCVVSCDAKDDRLSMTTVFLTGDWLGARVEYHEAGHLLRIGTEQTSMTGLWRFSSAVTTSVVFSR